MTSENTQYPIGTIVREDHKHTDGADGSTTWVLVEDHETVGGESVRVIPTWVALFSTSVGNLSDTLTYDELPLDLVEKIGVVPGTPAEQEDINALDQVVKGGDYPRVTWGTKADGSPWAVHIDFGAGVAINSTGDIWDNKKLISTAQADRKATALKEAMAWVVNDLVAISEGNKAHQLATGEQPKRKPQKARIGVDKQGYLVEWSPREAVLVDRRPWLRLGVGTAGQLVRVGTANVTELTDAESITVTASVSPMAVATFMGGTLKPARRRGDLYDIEVPGDGLVGLGLLTRVWRTEGMFYVAHKGSSLTVPVRRGA